MYASTNPKTKKALKEQVKQGPVPCHQEGPFGPHVKDGHDTCEGPHYPEPHRWYARVKVENNYIVKVLG